MAEITHSYPTGITTPEYEFRCIKLLVKAQTSIAGGAEELKKKAEEIVSNVKDLYDGKNSNDTPSSSSRVKGISNRTKKITTARTIYGVALPLPNELSDEQSHQWSTTEGLVADKVNSLADSLNLNKIAGEIASKSGFRKPMVDPSYFQDYKGSEPRSFSFSWYLIPNNVNEAENIMLLIYNLKKFTLPKTTVSGMSMLSPYLFDIEIGNPFISNLMNMNNVVCTSMNVTYSSEGTLQFLPDGIPKIIRLSMGFAERATITSEVY